MGSFPANYELVVGVFITVKYKNECELCRFGAHWIWRRTGTENNNLNVKNCLFKLIQNIPAERIISYSYKKQRRTCE